jgi:hypothetical protein
MACSHHVRNLKKTVRSESHRSKLLGTFDHEVCGVPSGDNVEDEVQELQFLILGDSVDNTYGLLEFLRALR